MANPTGIDVSHWNGPVSWMHVRQAGHEFVAAKATQGVSRVDERFHENQAAMRQQGFKWRVYYHWVTNADAVDQVNFFLRTVGPLQPGETLAVDAEDTDVPESKHREFIEELHKRIAPRVPLYYGGAPAPGFKNLSGKWPTWYAGYVSEERARKLSPNGWTVWQHTSSGVVPGIDHAVDMNRVDVPHTMDAITARPIANPPNPDPKTQDISIVDAATEKYLDDKFKAVDKHVNDAIKGVLVDVDEARKAEAREIADDAARKAVDAALKKQIKDAEAREAERWGKLFDHLKIKRG